jgi:hypothetical protein
MLLSSWSPTGGRVSLRAQQPAGGGSPKESDCISEATRAHPKANTLKHILHKHAGCSLRGCLGMPLRIGLRVPRTCWTSSCAGYASDISAGSFHAFSV